MENRNIIRIVPLKNLEKSPRNLPVKRPSPSTAASLKKTSSPTAANGTLISEKLPTLPKPLPDYRTDSDRWQSLQKIIDSNENLNEDKKTESPTNTRKPLPERLIRAMNRACSLSSVSAIRKLYEIDNRLALALNPNSMLSPLVNAMHSEDNFTALIRFLEEYEPGLALACLLHPDIQNHIPLEHALLFRRASTITILKIMAWMGDSLNTFELSPSLPELPQETLDMLLFACIVQGNLAWTEKVISWGGKVNACLKLDEEILRNMMALADLKIEFVLMESDVFNPKTETAHSTTFLINNCLHQQQSQKTKTTKNEISINLESILALLRKNRIVTFESLSATSSVDDNPVILKEKNEPAKQQPLPLILKPDPQRETQKKTTQYKLVPQRVFKKPRTKNIKSDFLNAIVSGDILTVVSLLQKDTTLAKTTSYNVADLLGVETRLTKITAYQCAYLMCCAFENEIVKKERLSISMNLFKHLSPETAWLQTSELGDVKDIVEQIKEKDFPRLKR